MIEDLNELECNFDRNLIRFKSACDYTIKDTINYLNLNFTEIWLEYVNLDYLILMEEFKC